MDDPTDFTRPAFWDARYTEGEPPWSHREVPVNLHEYLESAVPGRVLIPGCGVGYSVPPFARAGWDVTALDFSPAAVEQARSRLGELGRRVLLTDYFQHDFGLEKFDLCYEQSFLCALPPKVWPSYATRVSQLLRPGGLLLGTFFFGEEPDPPPYPLDDPRAKELFGDKFSLRRNVPIPTSHPVYVGGERWMEWIMEEPGHSQRSVRA